MDDKNAARFRQAAGFLHPRLAEELRRLEIGTQCAVREIRLRAERPAQVVTGGGAFFVTAGRPNRKPAAGALTASSAELQDSFSRLCAYSVHSHQMSIAQGFVAAQGGHRAGLCGTAVIENGRITGLRELSSINLRVAGEHPGAASGIIGRFFVQGLCSLLIAGPPASGKTTLLRDLARQLSGRGDRVCVLDERGEIAAAYRGIPQNDVGSADVLTGCPKGEGLQIALRCMNPQLVLCDEIGALEELRAVEEGLNAGVNFIATAHAAGRDDFRRRPQLRRFISGGAFDYAVLLGNQPGGAYQVFPCTALIGDTEKAHYSGNTEGAA
ncbi:MAG: Flp pilus assembly complex ATPase component TadA [Oscillospiraceae bacterium]|jgi:stage III sporulation protein AA|nr:Flp pilus assembly complex ATPase component TadA [Oscillospiraceae bacterium]